jgi:hypothetical protein
MELQIKICSIGFFAVAFKEINLIQLLYFNIIFRNFRYGKFLLVDRYILRIVFSLHCTALNLKREPYSNYSTEYVSK